MHVCREKIRHAELSLVVLVLLSSALAQSKPTGEKALQRNLAVTDSSSIGPTSALDLTQTAKQLSGSDEKSLNAYWDAYNTAVEHVSVWRNEDVRPLKTPKVAADGTVEVVTATKYDVTSPLYGDTWVTIVPELQTICRHFTGDVAMQVRELLGLPPDHQIPNAVVMKVRSTDIFRPTPDPTPWTLCPCGNPTASDCSFDPAVQCGNSFPKDVAPSHVQWIAATTLSVRQMPHGFPWTHLGYTYNWKPGADPYGASEYVVRKGTQIVAFTKFSLGDYCKP
jgi:hypothetical protein